MLNSQEEVLCFYVQDIVKHCRIMKKKLITLHTKNINYLTEFGYSVEESEEFYTSNLKSYKYQIQDVLEFVTSLPLVYRTRRFVVTGANNDQTFIESWQYLKESFEEYMNKISNNLKFYYKHIGKFYDSNGRLDETLIVKINKKEYTYKQIDSKFNLAINYLFDVSPLVYYDKFKYALN